MNEPTPQPKKLHRTATLLLTAALILLPTVTAQTTTNPTTGITVNGAGVAYGEPDRAIITLGVDATADNVRDALTQADQTMNQVRQATLDLGIPERQIRTTTFNVWRQQLTDREGQPTGERYHVQHTFQITTDDTILLSQLLTNAINAGANDIRGIRFTITNTDTLQTQAREAAMADAHARATQLAQLAGVTLGQAQTIEETSYNAPQTTARAQEYAMPAAASTPIESGELAVNVTVKVTYQINQPTD